MNNKKNTLEEQIYIRNTIMMTTVGNSMKPLLRSRKDNAVIKYVNCRNLKKYDISLYKRPSGKYVLHRIVKITKDYYYVRGDNQTQIEAISKDWVIGKVVYIYRNGIYVNTASYIYKIYVRIWCVIYPLRWIILKSIKNINKIKVFFNVKGK